MPRRTTRAPSGPTVTEVTFNLADVKAALVAYAEATGGVLPAGAVNVNKLRLLPHPNQVAAVLRVEHGAG